METFHNYLDDGSPLEKLALAIDVLNDLAFVCKASHDDEMQAEQIGSMISLVQLRLQQVYKELETASNP